MHKILQKYYKNIAKMLQKTRSEKGEKSRNLLIEGVFMVSKCYKTAKNGDFCRKSEYESV